MMLTQPQFLLSVAMQSDLYETITTNKKETFYNVAAGFDIETSSYYINDTKCACMYEWTFGIDDIVTYGRDWESLVRLTETISELLNLDQKHRLVVYVHNLPYEWQFMRKHFSWTKVFLLDDRKPVYAITSTGIEFRCSLKLSGKSLANTAKDLTKYLVEKKVGDLDYSLIRHSQTPLTETELGYCENDVRVILAYIKEKIEHDGDITRIPLTKTGYVRRYCRKACFPEMGENEIFDEELDCDTGGVSRNERSVLRRLYPRKCPQSWESLDEDARIRLCQFLSLQHHRSEIPDAKG